MYSREKVELFLLATEGGMGPTAAAEFAGVTVSVAKKWATGNLPRSYTGGGCRIVARKPPRKEASLGPDKSIYAPPATGPLAGLNEDQIEHLLLRAVLADLKAEGWDPASISNRSKCELGERLRLATALPLRSITGFLRISKSSYEYWRPSVAAPRYRDADIRDRVVLIFREGSGCWGVPHRLGAPAPRGRPRQREARGPRDARGAPRGRLQQEARPGLQLLRRRGLQSAGEPCEQEFPRRRAQPAVAHRHHRVQAPGRREGLPEPGHRLLRRDAHRLVDRAAPRQAPRELEPAQGLRGEAGGRTTIHSDRGGHYRWPEWIGICEENGLVRSMSAKGCSPDNSACEGFFGRLKNEFFRYREWEGSRPTSCTIGMGASRSSSGG